MYVRTIHTVKLRIPQPVSYTHLDVYKRQRFHFDYFKWDCCQHVKHKRSRGAIGRNPRTLDGRKLPVSYTHLDVYKRQVWLGFGKCFPKILLYWCWLRASSRRQFPTICSTIGYNITNTAPNYLGGYLWRQVWGLSQLPCWRSVTKPSGLRWWTL